MSAKGALTFFCGKMGAGKSTKSKAVSLEKNAVLLSEDEWLSSHYPGQINSFDDYLKFSMIIKPFVKAHVQQIISTGTNVVMDFPANTVRQRAWFKQLCAEAACDHELIFLDVSNAQCLSQIATRRTEQPERAQFDSEEVFNHITRFFEAPSASEGLNIVHVASNA
jgi:shikimate kinase